MSVIVQPCTELVIQSKSMLIISLCIFLMKYQVQVAIASADQISSICPLSAPQSKDGNCVALIWRPDMLTRVLIKHISVGTNDRHL